MLDALPHRPGLCAVWAVLSGVERAVVLSHSDSECQSLTAWLDAATALSTFKVKRGKGLGFGIPTVRLGCGMCILLGNNWSML